MTTLTPNVLSRVKRYLCSMALILSAFISPANASPEAAADPSAIREAVRQALPNTQITSMRPTPVPGLTEVIAGQNILYTDHTARYLIVGTLYDMHTATDLTAQRKAQLSTLDWNTLPLKAAVKYPGSGAKKLAVFFDPDCTWCHKLHNALTALDDVEVYAVMYPIEGLHPTAAAKAASILCAADPFTALGATLSGTLHPAPLNQRCLDQANRSLAEVAAFTRNHNIHGTPTLVSGDGRVHYGYLPRAELLAWLDQSRP